MAVYNEEKNLHYPLDSAYDLADEVIIVDGGSTDRTVEIAKSYGKKVKVIKTGNPKMFHKNKQKAIEAAKGDWILQLDADEALSSELKQEIKEIAQGRTFEVEERSGKTSEVNVVAFWLPRKNWFLTSFLMKGGQYPDYTIRLYRNGYARFPCKDVHENVEIISNLKSQSSKPQLKTEKQNGGGTYEVKEEQSGGKTSEVNEIGYLKNPLLHYADPDFSRYLMRWDRYTTLEVQNSKFKVQNKGKNSILMFLEYFIWKPITTFFSMYLRHKGFMDGFPGFVFALFSSIRFWVIYIKWKVRNNQ